MVTEPTNRGLEGVVAAETRLSRVDGESGELIIGGFPLAELAPNATYEECVFLFRRDRLPTSAELNAFRADLAARRAVPAATIDVLRAAAESEVPAMDALRMGVATTSLALDGDDRGDDDGNDDNDEGDVLGTDPEEETLALIARLPTIVAVYWRLRRGEEPLEPRSDLCNAANFLYLLTGEVPTEAETRGLETYLNTVIDHGLNASTFVARSIVSTESDLISAVTGAVGALKGPLHGGAPGPVLDDLLAIEEQGAPREYLEAKLDAGERLMGFGHRVYETRDPRAAVLSTAAERFYRAEKGGDEDFFDLARGVEEIAVDLLEERKPGRDLDTNVEFYTAVLLHGIGIPQELFTTMFASARVGGWTAHCLEQLGDNRLIRPRSEYVGETDRTWTPIDDRMGSNHD